MNLLIVSLWCVCWLLLLLPVGKAQVVVLMNTVVPHQAVSSSYNEDITATHEIKLTLTDSLVEFAMYPDVGCPYKSPRECICTLQGSTTLKRIINKFTFKVNTVHKYAMEVVHNTKLIIETDHSERMSFPILLINPKSDQLPSSSLSSVLSGLSSNEQSPKTTTSSSSSYAWVYFIYVLLGIFYGLNFLFGCWAWVMLHL